MLSLSGKFYKGVVPLVRILQLVNVLDDNLLFLFRNAAVEHEIVDLGGGGVLSVLFLLLAEGAAWGLHFCFIKYY